MKYLKACVPPYRTDQGARPRADRTPELLLRAVRGGSGADRAGCVG